MNRPLKIYLDQSAYGQFLNQSPKNWKQAPVASVLLREQAAGRALVWASPTNVLETLQSKERRRSLATIILALTGAKRMWHGSDFERVRDFLNFFEMLAPGFWRHRQFYEQRSAQSRRNWIGALALLACPEDLDFEEIIGTAIRNKAISRLLHARFAEDPEQFITSVKQAVDGMEVTKSDPLDDLKNLSIAEMNSEIGALTVKFQKLSRNSLRILNANRRSWAGAFGAMEIGRLLDTVFDLPMELMLMVDVRPVVRNWDAIKNKLQRSLPGEIAMADDQTLLADMATIRRVVQEMIYAATKAPLVSSRVGYEVIFRELQRCINQRRIPTGGLAFDADHSVAVCCFDIVLSDDEILVSSLKTLSGMLSAQSKGKLQPSIVTTARQLEGALKAQTALLERIQPEDEEL